MAATPFGDDNYSYLNRVSLRKSKINIEDKHALIETFKREVFIQHHITLKQKQLNVSIAYITLYEYKAQVKLTFATPTRKTKQESKFSEVNPLHEFAEITGGVAAAYNDLVMFEYEKENTLNSQMINKSSYEKFNPFTLTKAEVLKQAEAKVRRKALKVYAGREKKYQVDILDLAVEATLIPIARFTYRNKEVGLLNLANNFTPPPKPKAGSLKANLAKAFIMLFITANLGYLAYSTMMSLSSGREARNYIVEDQTLVAYNGSRTDIVIPKGVEVIKAQLFRGRNIKKVTFNDELKIIEKEAFAWTNLETLKFPSSLTTIAEEAFSLIPSLKDVTFNDGLTQLGTRAFASSGITNLNFPSSITIIGEEAFYKSHLTTINFAGPISFIGKQAFAETKLKEYIAPLTNSFYGANSEILAAVKTLEKMEIPGMMFRDSETFKSDFFKKTSEPVTNDYYLAADLWGETFAIPKSLKTITINDGHVGKGTFKDMNQVSTYLLKAGVTSIDEQAFANSGLTSLIIPQSVTYIGKGAFQDNRLSALFIPSDVSYIGRAAFINNPDIKLYFAGAAPLEAWDENWDEGVNPDHIFFNVENV